MCLQYLQLLQCQSSYVKRQSVSYTVPVIKDAPSTSCLHHHLSFAFPEGISKVRFVVLVDQVVEPGLASKPVHTLCNFVPRSVSETRKRRKELLGQSC